MKRTFLLALCLCTPLWAVNIAVVDLVRIVDESKAARSVADQVKAKRDVLEAEQQAAKMRFTTRGEALKKEEAILGDEAFRVKVLAFQKDIRTQEQSMQQKQRALDQSYIASIQKIRQTTVAIIAELAKKQKFDVAIAKSELLYSAGATDISTKVLHALDKRLSSVPLQ